MSIVYLLIFSIILLLNNKIESINIECSYETINQTSSSSNYYCDVQNQLNIISRKSAKISSARGVHEIGKSNDDVTCLFAHDKNVQIFPRGMGKIFKNLQRIDIYIGRLKEINQDDLKVFPRLIELDLWSNDIQVLDGEIFAYNPYLTFINFSHNKLVHIEENVFKFIGNLTFLGLFSNPCVSKTASNDTVAIMNIIEHIKTTCINSEILSIKKDLVDIEDDYKYIEIEDIPALNTKVDAFKTKFRNSTFINLPSIRERMQHLPNWRDQSLWNLKEQQKNHKEIPKMIKWIVISIWLINQIIFLIVIYVKFVPDAGI